VKTTSTPEAPAPWQGLRLPFDILVAPARAFAEILERPEWLSAYVLLVVAAVAELYLIAPAFVHVRSVLPPPDGLAGKPPAEIKAEFGQFLGDNALGNVVTLLIDIGLTATVLTTFARFKGSTTPYPVYASLAANCLVPQALGSLLSGLATIVRPASSYHDYRALFTALPDNLALFADPAHVTETLFLGKFDVFTIWSAILLAFGFTATAPVKFTTALAVSFALALVFSIVF
jgi:hypothetical protein